MNFITLSGVLLSLAYVGVFSLIACFAIYKFRLKLTREAFFRFWFLALICFILISVGIFYDADTFIQTFPFLKWGQLPNGTAAGILWLLIIWLIIIISAKIFSKDWDGKKSILQHEEEIGERKNDLGLILRAIFSRDPALKAWTGYESDAITPLIPAVTNIEKPWHIHAAELLLLVQPQYDINLGSTIEFGKNDWYEEEKCFIATYGESKLTVGIFCNTTTPTFGEIERFSNFVQQQVSDGKPYKLVAIIEEGEDSEKELVNIAGPIEFRYKGELISALMQRFQKYRKYVLHKYESELIATNSELTISQIYVEPAGQRLQRSLKESSQPIENPISSVETFLKDWLQDDSVTEKKQIALLGEYGQGKSVLSLRLAYSLFKESSSPQRLPVIFELRGTSPRSFRTQLEFLSVWAVNHDILPKVVLKLHELGCLLLIFEGFDEMDLVGNYEVRLNHFQKIWSFSKSNSKLLITGRPNFFLNDRELTTLLRTHQDSPSLPYCEEIHLDMFGLPQIEEALRYKTAEKRSEIMSVLKSSPESSGFRDLMKRPTLLFIAGAIWEEESLKDKGNKINSAYIMERFLEYSYKRQQSKLRKNTDNQFADRKPILEVSERAYFMMGIAVGMAQNKGYTNQIKQVDLNEIVMKLINGFDENITKKSKDRFYQTSFQERVQGIDARKSVMRDVISCGVLVRDFSGDDLFKFAHKSFLEYLVARYYVSLLLQSKLADMYQHIAGAISVALKLDLLAIHHTSDTAKFTGELLVNEAEINSDDYKVNAKKIFKFLYPVKIMDRFPQIAFPSFKAFFWGIMFGGLVYTLAAVFATVVHLYMGIVINILLFCTFFLFGLRLWFRVGAIFGMIIFGIVLIENLDTLTGLPLTENSDLLFSFFDLVDDPASESNDQKNIIIVFIVMGLTFLFTKLFLVKPISQNTWSLIAYENNQIDKLLQLWVIACEGIGVPDKYLLKFMSRRKLKKLRMIDRD